MVLSCKLGFIFFKYILPDKILQCCIQAVEIFLNNYKRHKIIIPNVLAIHREEDNMLERGFFFKVSFRSFLSLVNKIVQCKEALLFLNF